MCLVAPSRVHIEHCSLLSNVDKASESRSSFRAIRMRERLTEVYFSGRIAKRGKCTITVWCLENRIQIFYLQAGVWFFGFAERKISSARIFFFSLLRLGSAERRDTSLHIIFPQFLIPKLVKFYDLCPMKFLEISHAVHTGGENLLFSLVSFRDSICMYIPIQVRF